MEKFLSVIIPCYNAEPYINKLLDCLNPQITDEVEVIVVDDGSDVPFKTDYKWATVIRQENGGASSARNTGIDRSKSQYLAFIDADDLVSDKYISSIIKKAKTEKFDYLYMSWKTLPDGIQMEVKLNSIEDKFPEYNLCVWNRVYKRSVVGNIRFNTKKLIAEDAEFIKAIKEEGKKKSFISEFMYFYRTDTENSLTKRFQNGKLSTRRVVYHFPVVKKSMSYLIQEFKDLNREAEIILLTNNNEIPELEEYAMVATPRRMHGTELRGYPTNLFIKVTAPVKTDIVIWTEKTYAIGGIETFNYNFVRQMSPYYDITILYKEIDDTQKKRLSKYARVIENKVKIVCDTLIVNRITDDPPKNVEYKRLVQMVHSCKWKDDLEIPQDNDYLVAVSNAVARSYSDFKPDHEVIGNLTYPVESDKALILISATRTGTNEKGQKRMITLSKMLKDRGIPFVWFCFSDNGIQGAENICFMKPTLDISPYLQIASYLVQLSDHEGFCYSLVEALELGIPVLVTPLEVLPEIGFEDGKNGYMIPFDMDFDVDIIYKKQLKGTFTYKYDNIKRVDQWKKILGKGNPRKISFHEHKVKIRALIQYESLVLHRIVKKGEELETDSLRAYDLLQKHFVELVI